MKISAKFSVFVPLVLGAFLAFSGYAQEAGKAEQIIAASKGATGGGNWYQSKSWKEGGKMTEGGLEGTYQAWVDFPKVLTAEVFKLGPVKGSAGWNGKESWSTDSSDQLRIETSQAAIANEIKSAYQAGHVFYFPDRYLAELKYNGVKDDNGKPCDVIICQPKDSDPFEVWIDQSTHYPTKMVDLTGEQPQTTSFSDYPQFKGLTITFNPPFTFAIPKYDNITESQEIEFNGKITATRFDPPKQAVGALIFPAGKDQVSIPFQLLNNHIYLPVSLDGK